MRCFNPKYAKGLFPLVLVNFESNLHMCQSSQSKKTVKLPDAHSRNHMQSDYLMASLRQTLPVNILNSNYEFQKVKEASPRRKYKYVTDGNHLAPACGFSNAIQISRRKPQSNFYFVVITFVEYHRGSEISWKTAIKSNYSC